MGDMGEYARNMGTGEIWGERSVPRFSGVVMKFKMKFCRRALTVFMGVSMFCSFLNAQQPAVSASSAVVPRLVNFSARATDSEGKIISGIAGATFAIYKDQYEGSPLWFETENIQADAKGNYTVQLGATKPEGLPLDLFTSGEARWLGVSINSGEEQPRVMLISVPYALKAGDAETIGGLPPSAFVLANKSQATVAGSQTSATAPPTKNNASLPPNPAVTGKGVLNFIPMWDSTSDIVDSLIFQKSSQIGINTTTPAAMLDVNGKGDVRDTLTLFPHGTDPTLTISGTGFNVDQTGKVTFIKGQKFPGTVTGVTAGTGLVGGSNGGKVTLNLDTTKVPLLAAANVFTNNQAISGGPGTWGLAVSQPDFLTILEQGPESGVGTALEMQTTGTGGMSWQILNTGVNSSQGANKLNFRNDSAGVDVMTLTASGQVGIGTNSPIATLDVQGSIATSGNATQARDAGGMAKAMVFVSPTTGVLRCFNSALSGSAATTPPCGFTLTKEGSGFTLIDFGFQIDDRFVSAMTTFSGDYIMINVCTDNAGGTCDPMTPTQLEVGTYDPYLQVNVATRYWLIIY